MCHYGCVFDPKHIKKQQCCEIAV